MRDDSTPDPVPELTFEAEPADQLETIEVISHHDVIEAARAVIPAAVAARRTEFVPHPDGPAWPTILDIATGAVYVMTHEGGWRSGDMLIDVHPSETVTADEYEWIVGEFPYFHERWPAFADAMAAGCQDAKEPSSTVRWPE